MIEIKDTQVKAKLKKLRLFFQNNPVIMEQVGSFLKARITQRTLQGNDVSGTAFAPYSESYKNLRERSPKPPSVVARTGVTAGLPTRPDLFFSGHMIGSMTHTTNATSASVRLFFASGQEAFKAATQNEGLGDNPTRKFFAISTSEEQSVADMILTAIKQKMG